MKKKNTNRYAEETSGFQWGKEGGRANLQGIRR